MVEMRSDLFVSLFNFDKQAKLDSAIREFNFCQAEKRTGKKMSDVLIYSSINPQYSIPLLGRFTLIIHQNSISRTSIVHRLF